MPIVVEKLGKTVSEATISACEELGVSRDEIEVEILDEGSKGVFGIGERNAKVRATVKREDISEKGLKAKKNLEIILGFIVSPYSVSLSESSEKIRLDVQTSSDKGLIIGKRGTTIRAMEYLVGKIAGRSCEDGRRKRVAIDVDGYRTRKEESVVRKVKELAKQVKMSGKPITLDQMSSYERRLAYITLKKESGISYSTEKHDQGKRITITPARQEGKKDRYPRKKRKA